MDVACKNPLTLKNPVSMLNIALNIVRMSYKIIMKLKICIKIN